jgi:hypothetical protein
MINVLRDERAFVIGSCLPNGIDLTASDLV